MSEKALRSRDSIVLTLSRSPRFFELLSFAPVKVNLSFTRTDRGEIEEMRRARGAMALALDVLTTTIGNVHDAPIQLNVRLNAPYSSIVAGFV